MKRVAHDRAEAAAPACGPFGAWRARGAGCAPCVPVAKKQSGNRRGSAEGGGIAHQHLRGESLRRQLIFLGTPKVAAATL